MRRQLVKLTLSTLVILAAVCAIAVAGVLWRLNQGPISLTFLKTIVQDTLNADLRGMRVALEDVIIERDEGTGRPRFRLRELTLRDANDNILARAPRAAVEVNGSELLSGRIVAHQLDLIGARLLIKRKLDGSFQLGFGGVPATSGVSDAGKSDTGKSDAGAPAESQSDIQGAQLLQFLERHVIDDNADSALSELQAVLISQASVSLLDEANGAIWYAPRANMVFKRAPYGFALFVDASVASGAKPWRTEIVATYRREARRFTLSTRVFDLVPADIADDIFALSTLTQVNVPLSGHIELELTENGLVTNASAELSSGSGRIEFPGYISEPVLIDEGLLRFDYDPQTGDVVIGNSAVFIGGRQTELQGRVQPLRNDQGYLKALRFIMRAHNVSMDAAGDDEAPLAFDQVDFTGTAAIDSARLDVEDLILRAGKAGVRIRGRFVGEGGDVGVYVSGRIVDLPDTIVKKLWPPVVAPGAREWIRHNVSSAAITEGTFQLTIPGPILTAALKERKVLPDEVADVRFKLADVTTKYFADLPAITGVHGEGTITGNNFNMKLREGQVKLPSGARLEFVEGTMHSTNLVPQPVTPSVIRVKGRGKAAAFLELLDHKPLGLISQSGLDPARLSGDGSVDITFDIPMQKGLRADQVKITAAATLKDAAFQNIVDDHDIEDGNFELSFGDAEIRAKGPAKIAGTPVQLDWVRKLAKNGADSDQITASLTLNEERRQKLGIDVSEYMQGPIAVKLTAETRQGRIDTAHVEADLSKVAMRFAPIRWSRGATNETRAEFDLDLTAGNKTIIRKLDVSGKGFALKGGMEISAGGTVTEANFPTVLLNDENHFALGLQRRNDNLAVAVTGKVFDARPLIRSMFSSSRGDGVSGPAAVPTSVDVSLAKVYANRGEVINNLEGRLQVIGGVVQQSNLQGQFVNGAPVTLRINPGANGTREMRVTGRDGGGALRAANLYSKISGGSIDFQAVLGAAPSGAIQRGLLILRNFEVRNEEVLDDIEKRSPQKRTGPRRQSLRFSKLTLPFSTDRDFVRIGDALVKSAELGASAQGIIRKADGAMDIGGTIIPAYALNAALGEVPILGQLLVGGKGQGVFGLNFALKGSMHQPRFVINPVSAIAPGFLRRFFDIGGGGVAADGTPAKRKRPTTAGRSKIDN